MPPGPHGAGGGDPPLDELLLELELLEELLELELLLEELELELLDELELELLDELLLDEPVGEPLLDELLLELLDELLLEELELELLDELLLDEPVGEPLLDELLLDELLLELELLLEELPPSATASQIRATVCELLEQEAASATVAVAVTFTGPGAVQVNIGADPLVLLKTPLPVPPLIAHEIWTSALLPLLSNPLVLRAIGLPTLASDGLAEGGLTPAQPAAIVTVPLTTTEPLLPASVEAGDPQARFTWAWVCAPEATSKVAEPRHVTPVDVVAVSVMVYPSPAGSPPTTNWTAWLFETSTVPVRSAPSTAGL